MYDLGSTPVLRGHSAAGIVILFLQDRLKNEICCFKGTNYQKVLYF